jgi:hypothetical protein
MDNKNQQQQQQPTWPPTPPYYHPQAMYQPHPMYAYPPQYAQPYYNYAGYGQYMQPHVQPQQQYQHQQQAYMYSNAVPMQPQPPVQHHRQPPQQQQRRPIQRKHICESCDKSFHSEHQLQTHVKQHVSCSHCVFTASKQLVQKHEQDVHGVQPTDTSSIGTQLRIMESPEEIERWRAERRKNYPTADNVQRKVCCPFRMTHDDTLFIVDRRGTETNGDGDAQGNRFGTETEAQTGAGVNE